MSKNQSGFVFVDRNAARHGENFVPLHTLVFHQAGSLVLTDKQGPHVVHPGSIHLLPRNLLLKFNKRPSAEGTFRLMAVHIDQHFLRQFSIEHKLTASKKSTAKSIIKLKPDPLMESYFTSLAPYRNLHATKDRPLIDLKIKEVLHILLRSKPDLKNTLFDFNEPGKMDLEAFMQANYHFNVKLDRFAYLTGRSLATFKRDFQKIFRTSPHQWLLEKRLQTAYTILRKKERTVSDVYAALGFENMSHFSFAFKRLFGKSPSQL